MEVHGDNIFWLLYWYKRKYMHKMRVLFFVLFVFLLSEWLKQTNKQTVSAFHSGQESVCLCYSIQLYLYTDHNNSRPKALYIVRWTLE